ncbi:MAG: polymer-forming cytoskeletal protein [Nitrospinota bacterium]|nr:polymer-forming cytoskeletal protein [Nitrospinota bacterium]
MNDEKLDSFFSEGTVLRGTLKFKGVLRFDGDFEGSIQSGDTLIVGETGKVQADIKSGKLFNFGDINGNVKAEYKIHFYANSSLKGDIEAPFVVMDEACRFEGGCKMPPPPKNMPRDKTPDAKKQAPPVKTVEMPKAAAAPDAKKGGGWFGLIFWIVSLFATKGP